MRLPYIVIDDVHDDITRLVREADKTHELRFAGSFHSAYAALAALRTEGTIYPVIFCDIRLRDENGLDAGPELARYCKYLVFVTGLPHQKGKVLDAYGDDHLQKPVTCDQIRSRVLDRFFKRHADELPLRIHFNKLFIYDVHTRRHHTERVKDIRYILHQLNYLTVGVRSGTAYAVRATLHQAFALLEPAGIFLQVNRGAVVNMKFVDRCDGRSVWVGDTEIKLTGEGKTAFMEYVKRYKLGDGGIKDNRQ